MFKAKWKLFISFFIIYISNNNINLFANSSNLLIDKTSIEISCLNTKNKSLKEILDGIMVRASENNSSTSSIYNAFSNFYTYKKNKNYFFPKLNAGISFGSYWNPTFQKIYNGSQYQNSDLDIQYSEVLPNASLNWQVYDFGLSKSSKYFEFLAYSELANSKKEILNQALLASTSYINLYKYSKDLEIIKMLQKLYARHVEVTEGLQKAGKASDIDLNSAKASFLNYQGEEKIIQDKVDFYKKQILNILYLQLCELPPNKDLSIDFNFPTKNDNSETLELYLELSPEIVHYKNLIRANDYLEKSFTKSFLPSFNLNLSTTSDFKSGNVSGFKNGEYQNSYDYSLVGTFKWDIFNGNQTRYDKKSAYAKKQSIRKLLKDKEYFLENDLRYKIDKIDKMLQLFQLSKKGLDILSKQVELNNTGYVNGFKSSLDFRNAATEYYQVARKVTSVWVELLTEFLTFESEMLFPSFSKINNKLNDSNFNFKQIKIK